MTIDCVNFFIRSRMRLGLLSDISEISDKIWQIHFSKQNFQKLLLIEIKMRRKRKLQFEDCFENEIRKTKYI